MKTSALATALLLMLSSVACTTVGTAAAPAQAPAAVRWTFDGDIRNNSLAISPDERLAAVSYSERSDVIV